MNPLISVIIRSMDRPELRESLASLAQQKSVNLELLVVNASGHTHSLLDGQCGPFPVHLIEPGCALTRSQAANAGLARAAGEWIAFLDDDDWLAPQHFSQLMDALTTKSKEGYRAAYAGVAVVNTNRETLATPSFNDDFSDDRLRIENYIPIHSITFSKSLLTDGVCFDESFDVYEDWDFLLQLSLQTPFFHVNAVSAFYRASGTSGVGIVPNLAKQTQARLQILEKWKSTWSAVQVDAMLQFAASRCKAELIATNDGLSAKAAELGRAHMALDEAHAALDQAHLAIKIHSQIHEQVDVLEKKIAELEKQLQVAGGQLYNVLQSTSWRVTAPMRFMMKCFHGFCYRLPRAAAHRLRKSVQFVLGQSTWPRGIPRVSQGFGGEPIQPPGPYSETPLISVIVPVYNACRTNKRFLIRALESIANQSYPNVELIVVDDGSTDQTRQICEDFIADHPGLRASLLSKPNGGQSSARNFGVRSCAGEYVGFLDQDDEWYDDKLEKVVPWLANKNVDVLYTDSDSIDGDDQITHGRIHGQFHCGWPHPKSSMEDILFKDIFVMPGLMTIRKSAFVQVGGFDEKLSGYEDDDLFLRLYERFKFFYLPVPTLRWRMYGDNYSFSHRMLTSRTYYWRKLIREYANQGKDRYRSHMISLRFFWQFMAQAKLQYLRGNALCWASWNGAKEILPSLPVLQRLIFSIVFCIPEKYALPLLVRVRSRTRKR